MMVLNQKRDNRGLGFLSLIIQPKEKMLPNESYHIARISLAMQLILILMFGIQDIIILTGAVVHRLLGLSLVFSAIYQWEWMKSSRPDSELQLFGGLTNEY